MSHSNYNELTIPIENDGKYKVGDTYTTNSKEWRIQRFNGLTIRNIAYNYGIVLVFDYNEWLNAKPPIKNESEIKKYLTE